MRSCNCPECGAPIEVTENTIFAKCNHCGSTVDLSDFRSVKIVENRNIDEAAIIRAKTKAREIELEAENEKRKSHGKAIAIIAWIALIVVLWIASQFVHNRTLSIAPEIAILIGFTLLISTNDKKKD